LLCRECDCSGENAVTLWRMADSMENVCLPRVSYIVALQREDGIWDCMYVTLENVQECVLMTLFLGRLLGDNGK